MKRFVLGIVLLMGASSFVSLQAQRVNVNININSQPAWGPVGYDYVDYYYMPDINVYYNVPMSMFYYLSGRRWVATRYLPYSYRDYDFYTMYKVVLNERDPWRYNNMHMRDYGRYRGFRNQKVIYYSNDHRYRNSRNNRTVWYSNDRRSADYHRDNNFNDRNTRGNGRSINDRKNSSFGNANRSVSRQREEDHKKTVNRSRESKVIRSSEKSDRLNNSYGTKQRSDSRPERSSSVSRSSSR